MPSAATLSRAQLIIDTAYMLCMREVLASLVADTSSCVQLKMDSSPQGGNDYLVIEFTHIYGKDEMGSKSTSKQRARKSTRIPRPQTRECVGALRTWHGPGTQLRHWQLTAVSGRR